MTKAVAVTVPLESALPRAVAQRPTLIALAVADFSEVIVVAELRVTVVVDVAGLLDPEPNSRAAITRVLPDTDVTEPRAMAPKPARPRFRAAPVGKPEGGPPVGKPDGRAPVGKPDGRAPPPPN